MQLKSFTEKTMPKKQQQSTFQIGKGITMASSNIIEESFANATSNDIFTAFEEELVTDDIRQSTLSNQENMEIATSAPVAVATTSRKDEFDIFGNFVS